jgi:hypothetical protein
VKAGGLSLMWPEAKMLIQLIIPVYNAIKNIPSIHFVNEDDSLLKEDLKKVT